MLHHGYCAAAPPKAVYLGAGVGDVRLYTRTLPTCSENTAMMSERGHAVVAAAAATYSTVSSSSSGLVNTLGWKSSGLEELKPE